MAKRRVPATAVRANIVVITVALLVGVGVGAGLAIDHFRPTPPSATPRTPTRPTAPAPSPTDLTPPVVVADQSVDAAIGRALRRIGAVGQTETETRAGRVGAEQVTWQHRTIDVRLATRPQDATAQVRAEVEGAGGHVFAAAPTSLEIGLFRAGVPFVTHTIRYVVTPSQGRVVIIFDDAGGSLTDLDPVIALGRPVTVAVLPGLRYSREVATLAQAAGLEVFLHLPVEPEDVDMNLGPGGVTTAMTDQNIATMVRADLAWVPGVVGINNHMGSKGTADERVMRAILDVAKERGLIFIDSRTTLRSVGARVATEMRVPTAIRDVFLDNENDPEAIRERLKFLIAVAKRKGTAVAIGHTHRLTARVLAEMLPEFDRERIDIVPVSTVVH